MKKTKKFYPKDKKQTIELKPFVSKRYYRYLRSHEMFNNYLKLWCKAIWKFNKKMRGRR